MRGNIFSYTTAQIIITQSVVFDDRLKSRVEKF